MWMIASYFMLPDIKQRFYIYKQYAWEIVSFGKWIFVGSIVYFLSNNYDRLYFAKVVPLELLGITDCPLYLRLARQRGAAIGKFCCLPVHCVA